MRALIIILIVLAFCPISKAQDPQFSQFYSNPLHLAPSWAGSTENLRLVGIFRDQWTRIPGSFVTYSFSADHYIPKYNSGLGLIFLSDQAGGGKLIHNMVGLLYSYKLKVTHNFYLQPGLSAYYNNRFSDYGKVTFADQFFDGQFVGSSSEILPIDRTHHADFAFSVIGYTENEWFGFNIDHLMSLSPVLSEDNKYSDLRFAVFMGRQFVVKRYVSKVNNEIIHAAFNYRYQSLIHQLDIGAYYFKRPLIFGLWYRGIPIGNTYINSDALIFQIGIKLPNYTINYSYDMSMGQLISTSGGSHEISLLYTIDTQGKYVSRRKYRSIPCPSFF